MDYQITTVTLTCSYCHREVQLPPASLTVTDEPPYCVSAMCPQCKHPTHTITDDWSIAQILVEAGSQWVPAITNILEPRWLVRWA